MTNNLGTAPLPREPYAGLPDLPLFNLTSTDLENGAAAPTAMLGALWRARRAGSVSAAELVGIPRRDQILRCHLLRPGCAHPQRLLALDRIKHPRSGHRA